MCRFVAPPVTAGISPPGCVRLESAGLKGGATKTAPERRKIVSFVPARVERRETLTEDLSAALRVRASGAPLWGHLRAAEKIALGFFVYTTLHALAALALRERAILVSLNILVGVVIVVLSIEAQRGERPLLGVLRDWLPCALIVLAYRESGLFLPPDLTHGLDLLFIRGDRALFENSWVRTLISAGSPWLERSFELSYLLTYPFVPLGFAAVYFARRGARGAGSAAADEEKTRDSFWTTVLLAALASYALFPLFPLTPPRVLFHDLPGPSAQPWLRAMNLWILKRYSVQACIFPSGHVAAGVATALAVRARRPWLGALFLLAAAGIAAGTVFGRYHYAADALAGALVGVTAYALSAALHRSKPRAGRPQPLS
jgi:membrane-associated phospholipid phosphatase